MEFKPIVPSKNPFDGMKGSSAAVAGHLRDFAAEAVNKLQAYPTQRSATYRRTGRLGQDWSFDGPHKVGSDLIVQIGNNRDYMKYVQGSDKAGMRVRWAKPYGWTSVSDVAASLWPKYQSRIRDALSKR